jgi:hypothetical protein
MTSVDADLRSGCRFKNGCWSESIIYSFNRWWSTSFRFRVTSGHPVLKMQIWIYWSESNFCIYFYIVLNKNWKKKGHCNIFFFKIVFSKDFSWFLTQMIFYIFIRYYRTIYSWTSVTRNLKLVLHQRLKLYMIDSDQHPFLNRHPLLKSASTDVIVSIHGPI